MLKHWQILDNHNGYYHISSPTMMLNDQRVFESFGEKKALYKGLKELEKDLQEKGAFGWFSWTLTSRPHVMRLFTKVGAIPYKITVHKNPEYDQIWFKKSLTGA